MDNKKILKTTNTDVSKLYKLSNPKPEKGQSYYISFEKDYYYQAIIIVKDKESDKKIESVTIDAFTKEELIKQIKENKEIVEKLGLVLVAYIYKFSFYPLSKYIILD